MGLGGGGVCKAIFVSNPTAVLRLLCVVVGVGHFCNFKIERKREIEGCLFTSDTMHTQT